MPEPRLPRSFFARSAELLARDLLGQMLVRILPDGQRLAGQIVETEAYVGVLDRASHAFDGRRTPRNESMYARAGTSYVYFTYGMHHCFNVVCGKLDEPVAVLIRALAPLEGLETMRSARAARRSGSIPDHGLCSGPGRLCQAMAIDLRLNGSDLVTGPDLFIERRPGKTPKTIVNCPRIGIDSAGSWAGKHLRWLIDSNPHVSVPAAPARSAKVVASERAGQQK